MENVRSFGHKKSKSYLFPLTNSLMNKTLNGSSYLKKSESSVCHYDKPPKNTFQRLKTQKLDKNLNRRAARTHSSIPNTSQQEIYRVSESEKWSTIINDTQHFYNSEHSNSLTQEMNFFINSIDKIQSIDQEGSIFLTKIKEMLQRIRPKLKLIPETLKETRNS